jgi:hypothetical protein
MTKRTYRVITSITLALSIWSISLADTQAATASNFVQLQMGGDYFYNYDNTAKWANPGYTDWPVTVVFTNNAEIDKIKNNHFWGLATASEQNFRHNENGAFWDWDVDKGTKNGSCLTTYKHMRLYAPPTTDRFFNNSWGYYVLGTTHIDDFECGVIAGWAAFGWSEDAEHLMADQARLSGSLLTVNEDAGYFHNIESPRWDGDHFWQSNGLATYISVNYS